MVKQFQSFGWWQVGLWMWLQAQGPCGMLAAGAMHLSFLALCFLGRGALVRPRRHKVVWSFLVWPCQRGLICWPCLALLALPGLACLSHYPCFFSPPPICLFHTWVFSRLLPLYSFPSFLLAFYWDGGEWLVVAIGDFSSLAVILKLLHWWLFCGLPFHWGSFWWPFSEGFFLQGQPFWGLLFHDHLGCCYFGGCFFGRHLEWCLVGGHFVYCSLGGHFRRCLFSGHFRCFLKVSLCSFATAKLVVLWHLEKVRAYLRQEASNSCL